MHRARLLISLGAVSAVVAACGSEPTRSALETATLADEPAPGAGFGTEDTTTEKPKACVATRTKASHAQVDVIVVIDTSGSMDEETDQVKENLNGFARSIGKGGLDYNVILIARRARSIDSSYGICVQPPLAGPNCTDTPVFHHLDVDVDSENSLQILLDRYPSYAGWLRAEAYKVFIEVTDDNSSLPWESFDRQLLATSAEQFGDATNRRYIFNSVCGYDRGTPILSSNRCRTAVNTGAEYQQLSKLTGGTVDSVCETSYASVFDNIASDLVRRVGCEFSFPKDDGKGHTTDPSTVVVKYTPGDGSTAKAFTQVTHADACGTTSDAWYYDDAKYPTKIVFCPATCAGAGADVAGEVDIDVGCRPAAPK